MMKSRREKVVLQYISIDEKIRRHSGKASVQDERVCILKKQARACGDDFLIEKGRDDSQVGREH